MVRCLQRFSEIKQQNVKILQQHFFVLLFGNFVKFLQSISKSVMLEILQDLQS